MPAHIFIFGYGYTAKSFAPKLLSEGFNVHGTSRIPEQKIDISPGVTLLDFNSPYIDEYMRSATHLLICIPPADERNDIVLANYSGLIKKNASGLQWVGYLSSTGVYGDHQGQWVDENIFCKPHTPTGIARLKAENEWIAFAEKNYLPLHVFRLSGIYGPGRNPIQRFLNGKKHSIYKENQVFNRIHVEDIHSTLLSSMALPNPLSIYNISDNEPAPIHIVDSYVASLLQQKPLPIIPFSEADLSPMEQAFYINNRRVSNLKIKSELKVRFKYPTYREGLTQLWQENF